MDEKILEAARKYLGLAQDIMTFEATEPFDGGLPLDVQTALLRLYYAKKVDIRIQKCEALLTDETEQTSVDALSAAAEAVDDATLAAIGYIEEYMRDDRDFARMLDKLSMSTDSQGIEGQLCKLYKCESIIKETFEYASAHSYGLTPEEYISERMDVDMDALMELRQSLLDDISKALGETA
jgi:hypothetical protein